MNTHVFADLKYLTEFKNIHHGTGSLPITPLANLIVIMNIAHARL
jgi:hypothetical protein